MSNQPTRCRIAGSVPEKTFPSLSASGTASAAVINLAAKADMCWVIGVNGIQFSYRGGTFAGGSVTLAYGTGPTDVMVLDVDASGLAPLPYPKPLKFPVGAAVRLTLASGGSGVLGRLNLVDYWYEADSDPSF